MLINRRRDGSLEIEEKLIFHGGSGATLEMREFGATELKSKLLASGFREVHFLTENVPEIGILFDHDVSQPLIARKEKYVLDGAARSQLVALWRQADDQARREKENARQLSAQMSQSRWLRLGKKLGLGPNNSRLDHGLMILYSATFEVPLTSRVATAARWVRAMAAIIPSN